MKLTLTLGERVKTIFIILTSVLTIVLSAGLSHSEPTFHIRDNDPGFMTQVDVGSVTEFEEIIDFEGNEEKILPGTWGIPGVATWGNRLAGMGEECLAPHPNNPPQSPDSEFAHLAANGKLIGPPSVPVEIARSQLFLYRYPGLNRYTAETLSHYAVRSVGSKMSFSIRSCGDWGDAGWAMAFDEPRGMICIDVLADTTNRPDGTALGERVHFEFWGEDGLLVGHYDLTHSERPPVVTQACWTSTVPIKAFTTWPQNTPKVWVSEVAVGAALEIEPPTLSECREDLSGNGVVDIDDVQVIVDVFGKTCE